ncbi:hypothetical protein C8Q75DRAFT_809943 [Abortiporus biennis]|nr:hypothetical protein C8Q75DRAFT_809943 [Abortiporus biennis]
MRPRPPNNSHLRWGPQDFVPVDEDDTFGARRSLAIRQANVASTSQHIMNLFSSFTAVTSLILMCRPWSIQYLDALISALPNLRQLHLDQVDVRDSTCLGKTSILPPIHNHNVPLRIDTLFISLCGIWSIKTPQEFSSMIFFKWLLLPKFTTNLRCLHLAFETQLATATQAFIDVTPNLQWLYISTDTTEGLQDINLRNLNGLQRFRLGAPTLDIACCLLISQLSSPPLEHIEFVPNTDEVYQSYLDENESGPFYELAESLNNKSIQQIQRLTLYYDEEIEEAEAERLREEFDVTFKPFAERGAFSFAKFGWAAARDFQFPVPY